MSSLKQSLRHILIKILARFPFGPTLYDLYYSCFSSVQMGSLRGDSYPLSPWREDAPHVVIFALRYWQVLSALEVALAKEREADGCNVTVIGNDHALPVGDNDMYEGHNIPLTHHPRYDSYLLRKLCQRTGLRYLSMREYLKEKAIDPAQLHTHRDYLRIVRTSWTRLLRSLHPEDPAEFTLRDKLVESACITDAFLTHYLDHTPVDEVIMVNGKFFAEQLMAEHCIERHIPYITFERGALPNTAMFACCQPAIPAATEERWEKRKDVPLSKQERARLFNYMERRKELGNAELVPFYDSMTEDGPTLRKTYGINPNKKIVVLFTNTIWDSAVVQEDTIFENMFDWLSVCVEHIRQRDDSQLVIRVHPVEMRIAERQQTRERTAAYIEKHFQNTPNVQIIGPEEDASPYTLMAMADLGLIYTSTTGLEMAMRNKPVIIASRAHFSKPEFLHIPTNRDSFVALLDQMPGPIPDQQTYAERYAYMYFFEHTIPYGDVIQQVGSAYRFVGDLSKSTLLQRSGLPSPMTRDRSEAGRTDD